MSGVEELFTTHDPEEAFSGVSLPQDNFTETPLDEYWSQLPFAHKYWHQFNIKDIPSSWHYGVAIWMTFFGICGTFGNFLVIYIFAKTKHLRTPPNMMIVNLAIGDMMFSAINGFPLLTISSINKIWPWGETVCKLYGYAGGIFGLLSINTLAAIAYERYKVISQPLQAARNASKKKTFMVLVGVWIWSALWSTPPLFGWGRYVPEGFQTSCTYDYLTQDWNNQSFVWCMYFFSFIVPVAVIVMSYIGIVRSVFEHAAQMRATAGRMGATMSAADQEKRAEIQTAKTSAITVASFMLSWTPYATIAALGLIFPHSVMIVTPLMSEIPVMFAKASASYNPLIYAVSHPKYKAELYKRFPIFMVCCAPQQMQKRAVSKSYSEKGEASQATSVGEMSMTETNVDTNVPSVNPAGTNGQCT